MKLSELREPAVLILGLGREGQSTWRFLRALFPGKILGVADRLSLAELPREAADLVRGDARAKLHLGPDYLKSLAQYDVIVKSPGIPVTLPEYAAAVASGKRITSQTDLFFSNCPGKIVGVTGTKGKSTTASLIHAILKQAGRKAFLFGDPGARALDLRKVFLVGNIGAPALDLLSQADAESVIIYELSSHQLEGLRRSPHIAVLLNIVPEHLDYYESFAQYVAAKENIARYQRSHDWLVYDADHPIPREIAWRSPGQRFACSLESLVVPGCAVVGDWIEYALGDEWEGKFAVREVPLPGRFNLLNVAAAVGVARLLGVEPGEIVEAVRAFRPLEHRLERVGTYGGITYYNDAIATVPEATIAALDTLGDDVETILLGGADRHLDFSHLAERLLQSNVNTVILFPPTGRRIWQAICAQEPGASGRFDHFFVQSMEEAVALAKQHTAERKICLHSPASPSFGLFRDYRDRGEQFKQLVSEPRP
jgi:UDP-N-acetylmuramoylalanine--D-glutamate ligase